MRVVQAPSLCGTVNAKGRTDITLVATFFDRPINEASRILGVIASAHNLYMFATHATCRRHLPYGTQEDLPEARPQAVAEPSHPQH